MDEILFSWKPAVTRAMPCDRILFSTSVTYRTYLYSACNTKYNRQWR